MIRYSVESNIAKRRKNRNRILLLLNIPETVTTDDVRQLVARAGLRCIIPDVINHNETPVKFSTFGNVTKALFLLNQLQWFDLDRTPVQAIRYGDSLPTAFTGARGDHYGLPPVN